MNEIYDVEKKKRTHVVNVRIKNDGYIVVLRDKHGNEFTCGWEKWISMSEKERHSYE